MLASVLLRSITTVNISVPSLSTAVFTVLTKPFAEVGKAEALADAVKSEVNAHSSTGAEVSDTLLLHKDAWKLLGAHPTLTDSLLDYYAGMKPVKARQSYNQLLAKGCYREKIRLFTNKQAFKVLHWNCEPLSKVTWEGLGRATTFMRVQDCFDPHILDFFTSKCLHSDAPLETVIDYLHSTWRSQPINYELEWQCRERLKRSWTELSDRIVIRALMTLLRSSVRGDMATYLKLISRINTDFVKTLRIREQIICLACLAKCKSRQIHIETDVIKAVAKNIKMTMGKTDSKTLFIVGKALGEVDFGENEYFTLLRKQAEVNKDNVSFLDFLEQTTVPIVEAV